MNFQAVFVDPGQKVALDFLIVDIIETEQIIKVENLVIFREDVVGCPDVSDVSELLLLPADQDPDLDPLLRELVGGGDGGSHGAEDALRHLLHRARGVDLETLLEPDALRVEVHHPVHGRVAAVVRRGLVRGEVQGAAVVDWQLQYTGRELQLGFKIFV